MLACTKSFRFLKACSACFPVHCVNVCCPPSTPQSYLSIEDPYIREIKRFCVAVVSQAGNGSRRRPWETVWVWGAADGCGVSVAAGQRSCETSELTSSDPQQEHLQEHSGSEEVVSVQRVDKNEGCRHWLVAALFWASSGSTVPCNEIHNELIVGR